MSEFFTTLLQLDEFNLVLSAFVGLIIGLERAWRGKVASIRTFSMICSGSCLYTLLSIAVPPDNDVGRIAAQIVPGVGFLGGGVIFKSSNRVEGITTAAMIWLTAAIGMALGFKRTDLGLSALCVFVIIQIISTKLHHYIDRVKKRDQLSDKDLSHGPGHVYGPESKA